MDTFDELNMGGVDLLEIMGRNMLYSRRGDAPFVVRAILDESARMDDPNGSYGDKVVLGLSTLHVLDRDLLDEAGEIVMRGVPVPKEGDTVEYKSRTFYVRNFAPDGMGLNVIQLGKGPA
jgi:hypothetical protein